MRTYQSVAPFTHKLRLLYCVGIGLDKTDIACLAFLQPWGYSKSAALTVMLRFLKLSRHATRIGLQMRPLVLVRASCYADIERTIDWKEGNSGAREMRCLSNLNTGGEARETDSRSHAAQRPR